MDALITIADFTGLYNIAVSPSNDADLALFITEYQDKYLRLFMGEKMYSEFDPEDNIYKPLIDGSDVFMLNSVWIKFDGLKKMLVPFVYFHFMRENSSKQTPVGLVDANVSNSIAVKPIDECIMAWNNAVKIFNNGVKYCLKNNGTFPNFQGEELGTINHLGI